MRAGYEAGDVGVMKRFYWVQDPPDKTMPDIIWVEENNIWFVILDWHGRYISEPAGGSTLKELIQFARDYDGGTLVDEQHPDYDQLMARIMRGALTS